MKLFPTLCLRGIEWIARDETGNDEGSGMILLRAAFSGSIKVCTFNAHWEESIHGKA